MTENHNKLLKVLKEIFQLDQSDLDFGIYRIMNSKSQEINEFLDDDLLSSVKEAFSSNSNNTVQKELDEAIEKARELGADPEKLPKVLELRDRIAHYSTSANLENEVFSHLTIFFKRYYKDGDFVSLRRYKKDTYAIPYEGEEVKLHWANSDQYYIKSGEYFRDYSFTVGDNENKKTIHFKLSDAETESNNNKATADKTRRFVLLDSNPCEIIDNELYINFEYKGILRDKRDKNGKIKKETPKQKDLNTEAIVKTLGILSDEVFKNAFNTLMPTAKNKNRTLFEKHLKSYTSRNSFDYFIHKDLGGFLGRELDFYIKNEMLFLDDIMDSPVKYEEVMGKIKIFKEVSEKIIAFLTQLEELQKKLWEKKKFIIETNYCITLDKISEDYYEQILACDEQKKEWRYLFDVDVQSIDDLKNEKFLVLDTKFFDDDEMDGVLINSENFGALNLLQDRYKEQVKTVYIDPPYNAASSEILYLNNYKHSSWISLMENRIVISKSFMQKDNGIFVLAIDENEQENIGKIFDLYFSEYQKTCVSVIHNPGGIQGNNFSYSNEFAYFLYPNKGNMIKKVKRDESNIESLRDWGGEESKRTTAKNCFYPIIVNTNNEILDFGDVCDDNFHPSSSNIDRENRTIEIYPIDSDGIERKWRYARHTIEGIKHQLLCKDNEGIKSIQNEKFYFRLKTVWDDKKYNANVYGSKILNNILPQNPFTFPKSLYTVEDSIIATSDEKSTILDYFAGSGTTGHAVINLNREDASAGSAQVGKRKYILVEMGEYFDSVTKPRIKKVIYTDSWKDGKPQDKKGISQIFKYFKLESYEDTLNNRTTRNFKFISTYKGRVSFKLLVRY